MTCREKLAIEHPDKIDPFCEGGCAGCPAAYGYSTDDITICKNPSEENCTKCWNQEIPGTEQVNAPVTSETTSASAYKCEQIDIHKIIDEAMKKKDREVSIFIMKNNTSVYVKPFTESKPQWIYARETDGYNFKCSECGQRHQFEYPYCPDCGEKLAKAEV